MMVGRSDERTRAKPVDELGLSGLNIVTGEVDNEFLPALKGVKATRVFTEMADNDPVVGAVLHAIDMMLRGVEWSVQPAEEDSEEAERGADFVRECMEDMEHTWEEFISEVLTMLPHGWSFFEVVYKLRNGEEVQDWEPSMMPGQTEGPPASTSKHNDGRYGWRKFAIRSQETRQRWEVDSKGNIHGLWQQSPPTYELTFIPMAKSLLFRTTSRKNNPEGRSVLRNAYRPWYFKKRIEEIEGIGIERDLAGLPVAYIPAEYLAEDASDEDKYIAQLFYDAVKNVRRDSQEGLVLPMQYDPDTGQPLYQFTLLSTGGARSFNTDAIIQRYDQRIAMTVLADIILLGHDAVGSYALATSKEGMLRASLTAWLDLIAEVLNRFELPRLWRINGFDPDTMPSFTHGEVDSPTPSELAQFIQTLASTGMPFFPNQELENHLLEVAKLPQRTEEEWNALYEAQQAQQQAGQFEGEEEEAETTEFVPGEEPVAEEEEVPEEEAVPPPRSPLPRPADEEGERPRRSVRL